MAGPDDQETPLGAFIRKQRELHDLSMRQFADMVGISNPYLSQIERGLRDPSQKVLDAIATNLELSAGALYEQAGLARRGGTEREPASAVVEAIKADPHLTGRQRQAMLEIYEAFTATRRRAQR
jgi:transcriptional regulator with XRE-family HTH domain